LAIRRRSRRKKLNSTCLFSKGNGRRREEGDIMMERGKAPLPVKTCPYKSIRKIMVKS
jgi:hypothetical protein